MTDGSGARKKRILAVDFGDRRTGLAATDWTGTIGVPLETIVAGDDTTCARAVAETASERESDVIVVGLPLGRDGQIGPRAERTLRFVDVLRRTTAIPVETVDESMSTDEAHARLKEFGIRAARRKRVADSVAALVILERYRAR